TTTNKWSYMDDIYEYTGGGAALERALRNLNKNSAFYGFIGAVFENGLATSVVIYDKTESIIDVGTITPGTSNISVSFQGTDVYVNWTGTTKPSVEAMVDAIQTKIEAMGWDEVYVTSGYDNFGKVEY